MTHGKILSSLVSHALPLPPIASVVAEGAVVHRISVAFMTPVLVSGEVSMELRLEAKALALICAEEEEGGETLQSFKQSTFLSPRVN